MAMRIFTQTFSIAGALAANHAFTFAPPVNCQLIAVSVCNESANAGKIDIGTVADPDGYLDDEAFGVSSAPTVFDAAADFDGAIAANQFPHIAAGTAVQVTITDHGSHMTAPCVVLTFTEG